MKTKTQKSSEAPLYTLGRDAFYRLIAQGVVVDGRAGGLLIGRQHDEGGIMVICQDGDDFHVQAHRLEGGDFVMSEEFPAAHLVPEFKKCVPDRRADLARSICTYASPDDKILWLTTKQVVVNRNASRPAVLYPMNEHQNFYAFCDLLDVFPEDEV